MNVQLDTQSIHDTDAVREREREREKGEREGRERQLFSMVFQTTEIQLLFEIEREPTSPGQIVTDQRNVCTVEQQAIRVCAWQKNSFNLVDLRRGQIRD